MRVLTLLLVALGAAVEVRAQAPAPIIPPVQAPAGPAVDLPATICGQTVGPPSRLPPAGSGPLVHAIMLCFEKQGGSSVIESYTYLYYLQLKGSQPSIGTWVPYDDTAQQMAIADFKRLWATNFLDDLVIEVHDIRYANGVPGKVVVYSMEERQRVKIVDYVGPKKVDQTKIEEELKKQNITIKLDSFIDPGLIRKVSGVRPRCLRGEGLSVRRGQAGDQARRGGHEDRQRDLQHHRRAEGEDPRRRLRGELRGE